MNGNIAVIGLGQSLRGDDAIGLEVVQAWRAQYPQSAAHEDVSVDIVELPGLHLLTMLSGVRLALIVDAIQSGAAPGTLREIKLTDEVDFASQYRSAHGWGVGESLALARALRDTDLPQDVIVLGIEIGDVGMGEGLSPDVAASLPEAVERLQKLVLEGLKADTA